MKNMTRLAAALGTLAAGAVAYADCAGTCTVKVEKKGIYYYATATCGDCVGKGESANINQAKILARQACGC